MLCLGLIFLLQKFSSFEFGFYKHHYFTSAWARKHAQNPNYLCLHFGLHEFFLKEFCFHGSFLALHFVSAVKEEIRKFSHAMLKQIFVWVRKKAHNQHYLCVSFTLHELFSKELYFHWSLLALQFVSAVKEEMIQFSHAMLKKILC